jgi:molybdopterin molybdotransferase
MITVNDARDLVLSKLHALPSKRLDLAEAHGCVLAEDIVAAEPVPAFDNSAMDGYAVRSVDLGGATPEAPMVLEIVGEQPAGSVTRRGVGPGEAIHIMTGAPLPSGADAVVMVEYTRRCDGRVHVLRSVEPWENVRRRAEDIPVDQRVLPAGRCVSAGAIGLLAGLGYANVAVIPRPVVAILSTGDELLEPGRALEPGKIRDSNSHCIAALIREADAVPLHMGIARDDERALRAALERCLSADIVVTSGGVSVGDYDLVKRVLAELGEMLMWKVGQRPGKPLAFGMIRGKPLFGLPGNPGAALVSFENFVRPAIGKLAGREDCRRDTLDVVLGDNLRTRKGFRTYLGVTLERADGRVVAKEAGLRSSGALHGMANADALLEIPEDIEQVQAGDSARVRVMRTDRVSALQRSAGTGNHPSQRPQRVLPVVSIVGKSNSGKTTLLTRVVRELTRRGRRVVSIKHDAHSFDIDHEGKDSWRHFQSGTQATIISSPEKLAMVRRVDGEWSLDALAALLGDDADIVITEGYKNAAKPKIEVLRQARSTVPVCAPEELIALVTDVDLNTELPKYGLDDVAGVCDLVEDRFLGGRSIVLGERAAG